jgi:hypothetical protein
MGNRAIITTVNGDISIYLHWNGGIDSVTAFLRYCELRRFAPFPEDYGLARFTQVVANYFGGDMSIGISGDKVIESDADGLDNGIYVVDGWKIVKHFVQDYLYHDGVYEPVTVTDIHDLEREIHEGYDLIEMLIDIDNCQPEDTDFVKNRLGEDYIRKNAYEIVEKWNPYR